MRVPLQWLADYVDTNLTVGNLAHQLTMAGIKVETIDRIGEDWTTIRVGEIVELEPHPTSRNPLWVAKANLGDETIVIVTGAPNLRVGDRVPVVLPGGFVPFGPEGTPLPIERRQMAGITSNGMLCSARELGISEEHEGIYKLPSGVTVGASLRAVLGDDVLDIETNPNRPDTLSVAGIAREAAAITEQQLSLPDLDAVTGNVEWMSEESVPIEIEAPDLCQRYSALRIEGVANVPSPLWLARRLEAAGMRPINLLVDLTNYVMLEYGQPMHAFDATQFKGGRIVVRRAHPAEVLTTLDGIERQLLPDDLVIADGERAVGLAGVMGGENSEVSPGTTSMVLESADFDPISVRRTAHRLGFRTEASARFEKGLPPEQTVLGLKRYLQLLAQNFPGPLRVYGISDAYPEPPEPRFVPLPVRDLHRLSGIPISLETAADKLSLLGFGVSIETGGLVAEVPYWRRVDITQSADLVEEVIRLVGYDTIPLTLPRRTMSPAETPAAQAWEGVVRERLLAAGVSEAVTKTLTFERDMERLSATGTAPDVTVEEPWVPIVVNPASIGSHGARPIPLRLLNPPTRERLFPRLTLLPSLLGVVSRNLKHTDERVQFFEMARTYFNRQDELPYERRTLTIALSGKRRPTTWQETSPGPHTFFDVKGLVVAVLNALRIENWTIEPSAHPSLHPGRAASIRLGDTEVAVLGEVHPRVAERFEIDSWPVQVAEVDLDSLFAVARRTFGFQPLPRYPAARRDIAVLVPLGVPAATIERTIKQIAGPLLESAKIFDVYAGTPLPPDRKSVAVSIELRSPEGTLTQEEITGTITRTVDALTAQLGATLRE